jgi:outer membrane protein W
VKALVVATLLAVTGSAAADREVKRFYFRAGVVHIAPQADSDELELADVDGPASLSVQNGPISGSGATISDATIPGGVFGYVLPMLGDRLSIEVVLGIPFEVTFEATGTLRDQSIAPMALGSVPTGVPALGSELGTATAVPPVATLVYTFAAPGARFRPFVGAGAAMLFAYDEEITNPVLTEVAEPEFDIKPSPGLALQVGAEARLWRRLYARLDVKYIAFLQARSEVKHIQVRTPELPLFDSVEVGTARMNIWVNPVVVSLGIGLDF